MLADFNADKFVYEDRSGLPSNASSRAKDVLVLTCEVAVLLYVVDGPSWMSSLVVVEVSEIGRWVDNCLYFTVISVSDSKKSAFVLQRTLFCSLCWCVDGCCLPPPVGDGIWLAG